MGGKSRQDVSKEWMSHNPVMGLYGGGVQDCTVTAQGGGGGVLQPAGHQANGTDPTHWLLAADALPAGMMLL
jgi:hypothetical protein